MSKHKQSFKETKINNIFVFITIIVYLIDLMYNIIYLNGYIIRVCIYNLFLYFSFLNNFKKIKAKRLEIDQGDKNEKKERIIMDLSIIYTICYDKFF